MRTGLNDYEKLLHQRLTLINQKTLFELTARNKEIEKEIDEITK